MSARSRASRIISSETGWTPISPWITSSTIAQVRPSTAALSASRSFRSTWRTPGTSGAKGSCLEGWPVRESAPKVRPWKPSTRATTSVRPGPAALRASLSAASLASAPELQKKTRPPRERSRIHSASAIIGSV